MRGIRGVAIVAAALAVTVLAGCSDESGPRPLIVGASSAPAMQVMAQIYAGALRQGGTPVADTVHDGDDAAQLAAMGRGDVDLFPAFDGRLVAELAPELTPVSADDVYTDVNRSLPQGVSVGDQTAVAATEQVVVAAGLARASGATDLGACGRLPPGLPVITTRAADGPTVRALESAGCLLGPVRFESDATAAVRAVAAGGVIGILTPFDTAADPSAAVQALAVPDGMTAAPRAQELLPVFASSSLSRPQARTINKVAGEMTTPDLVRLAHQAGDGADPAELARTWLAEHEG